MVQPGKELPLWLPSSPRDSHRVVVGVEIKRTRVGGNCDRSIVKLTCSERRGRKQSYNSSKDKAEITMDHSESMDRPMSPLAFSKGVSSVRMILNLSI